MNATLIPSAPPSPSRTDRPGRSASPAVLCPILLALATSIGIAGIGLGIALITGATVAFSVLVFALFTVLWVAFVAALSFSPRTLDDTWHQTRQLAPVIQWVVWLLFLPPVIGLWIWEQRRPPPMRLTLIIGLGVANVFMFFPRSL